ncbi:hypothetical protein [Adonisia turfae]|uniref:hypothetical protein n=1 Tax=Adonisia turfae TaxID=2950184 RepID=UPI0013D423A2|nr:hypothetical protein [Adonisia turfae]
MGVSRSYLRDRRKGGQWPQGTYWVYLNPDNPRSGIRYNVRLCLSWFTDRGTHQHDRAVHDYLMSTLPEQPAPGAEPSTSTQKNHAYR